jgi:hypothetical protein
MITENVAKCLMVHKKKTQAVSPNFIFEGNCTSKKAAMVDAGALFTDYKVARCWIGPKGSNTEPKSLSNDHSELVQSILKPTEKHYRSQKSVDSENILFDEKHYVHDSGAN